MEKAQAKPYKKIDKELVTKPITYVHANQEDLEDAEEVSVDEVKDEVNEVENTNDEANVSSDSEE